MEKLKRRLQRATETLDTLRAAHTGKEQNFTYWGGWEVGYYTAKVVMLEEMIEAQEELMIQYKNINHQQQD